MSKRHGGISRLLWAHMSEQQEFLDRHVIFGFWTLRNCNPGNISYTDFVSNQRRRVIGLMMFGVSDGNVNHSKEGCCQPAVDNEYRPISWGVPLVLWSIPTYADVLCIPGEVALRNKQKNTLPSTRIPAWLVLNRWGWPDIYHQLGEERDIVLGSQSHGNSVHTVMHC